MPHRRPLCAWLMIATLVAAEEMPGPVSPLAELRVVCLDPEPPFAESVLAAALADHPPVFLAAHPMGSRQAFRDAVEEALTQGLLRHGHLESEVSVAWDAEGLSTEVTAGPRSIWAEPRISGLNAEEAAILRAHLLGADDQADENQPLIVLGEPCCGDRVHRDRVRDALHATCERELGRAPETIAVRIEQLGDGRAAAAIAITDPDGPRGYAGFRVESEQAPGPIEDALRAAIPELTQSLIARDRLRERSEAVLAESGRILDVRSRWEPAPDADGQLLVLAVDEHPDLPPFGVAFTPLQTELLRFHERIQVAHERGEVQLIMRIQTDAAELRLATDGHGLAAELSGSDGDTRRSLFFGFDQPVVVDSGAERYHVWAFDLLAQISLVMEPDPGAERQEWSSSFNLGTQSGLDHSEVHFDLAIAPAALLLHARNLEFEDGRIRLRDVLRAEHGTQVIDPDGETVLALSDSEGETHLELVIGAPPPVPPTLTGWTRAPANLREDFIADTVAFAMRFGDQPTWAEAATVWLPALQRWWPEQAPDIASEDFGIPLASKPGQAGLMGIIAAFGPRLHRALGERMPRAGWPLQLLRELVHLGWGDAQHLRATINTLIADERLGPIGYRALVAFVPAGPAQRALAESGLDACVLAGFRTDLAALGLDDATILPLLVELGRAEDPSRLGAVLDGRAARDLEATVTAAAGGELEPSFAADNFARILWRGGLGERLRRAFARIAGVELDPADLR